MSEFGETFAALPAVEILSSEGGVVTAPPRRRRTAVIAGVAAVAVLAAAGAGFAAFSAFNGSGSQPEAVLPASTIAFVKVDLDPSAGQKLELFNLLQKFPHSAHLQASDTDFGDWLVRRLVETDDGSSGITYAADVKPWLGKRFAVAAVPGTKGAGSVDALVVLQDTDDKAAAAALTKMRAKSSSPAFDFAFADGYVVIAPESANAAHRAVAAAATSSLAANHEYVADVASLGSDEVVTGWADGPRVGAVIKKTLASASGAAGLGSQAGGLSSLVDSTYQGRFVLGLHATDGSVELKAELLGGKPAPAVAPVTGVDHTASDAVGVLAISGLDTKVDSYWANLTALPEYKSLLDQAQKNLHLDLPGDLKTLLGSELDVSVGGDLSQSPSIVAAATSKDPGAAKAVLDKILGAAGATDGVVGVRTSGDVLYVGSSQDAVDAAGTTTAISKDPLFARAVADPAGAQAIGFVDLTKVWRAIGTEALTTASDKEAEHLAAVGFSTRTSGGNTSVTVRLVLR